MMPDHCDTLAIMKPMIDPVEDLLIALEHLHPRWRLHDISLHPAETSRTGRSVSFVVDERYDVSFHGPTLLDALRTAHLTITREILK